MYITTICIEIYTEFILSLYFIEVIVILHTYTSIIILKDINNYYTKMQYSVGTNSNRSNANL